MRCPHDHRAVPAVYGDPYDATAMCLRAYDFFQICNCAELNRIVEATMPYDPYDDRKVYLLRPHGNGDLDIVQALSQGKCNRGINAILQKQQNVIGIKTISVKPEIS